MHEQHEFYLKLVQHLNQNLLQFALLFLDGKCFLYLQIHIHHQGRLVLQVIERLQLIHEKFDFYQIRIHQILQ